MTQRKVEVVGTVAVSGSFSAPGVAQETTLAQVEVSAAATVTAIGATNVKLDTVNTKLDTANGKLPDPSTLTNIGSGQPSVSRIGAHIQGREENSNTARSIIVNSLNQLQTTSYTSETSTQANSTTWQVQRTVASFSSSLKGFEAYNRSGAAGFIVFFNASSAVADGASPRGAKVFPIAAGGRVEKEWIRGQPFTTGIVVAFCSAVSDGTGTPKIILGTADCIFTVNAD